MNKIEITAALTKTLVTGVVIGASQLGAGMLFTLRGTRNLENSSKIVTEMAVGRTGVETLKTTLNSVLKKTPKI